MKILVFASGYGKGNAATNQLWTELCEHLASGGHEVKVVTAGSAATSGEDMLNGVNVAGVGGGILPRIRNRHLWEAGLWFCMAWKSLTLGGWFDLVLCVDTPRFSTVIAALRKLRGPARIVMWVMDLPLEQVVRRGGTGRPGSAIVRAVNGLFYWSLNVADQLVVIGTCMRDELARHGVKLRKMEVIGVWSEDALGEGRKEASLARRENELPDYFTVMYQGYAGAWHEFGPMIEAIPEIIDRFPIQFVFGGNGPGIDRVSAEKSARGWERVIVNGWVPREQLAGLLSCGDIHLVSLKENMLGTCNPSKTYGSMAFGRPVVFLGPRECQAAKDLRLADAGEVVHNKEQFIAAIENLFSDRARLDVCSRNAREAFLKRHSASVVLKQWGELLQRLKS